MQDRSWYRRTIILFLSVVSVFGFAACERDSDNTTVNTPTPSAAVAVTLAATPSPTAKISAPVLPADSQVLNKIEQDMNGDDVAESVIAFRAPSGDGLAIGDWTMTFPKGYQIEEIEVRHLRDQKLPEVLAYVQGENPLEHYLYVAIWGGGSFALLKPEGGPSAGQDAFRSDYIRPLVEDGDFNGTEEIVLCLIAANPDYLEIYFYEWDQGALRHTTRFFAIPRHISPEMRTPAAASSN